MNVAAVLGVWFALTLLALAVFAGACRAGHLEDVVRGFSDD